MMKIHFEARDLLLKAFELVGAIGLMGRLRDVLVHIGK